MVKRIGRILIIGALIASFLASYVVPAQAEEFSTPEEFIQALVLKVMSKDEPGTIDLIVNNKNIARTAFRNLIAEIETSLDRGVSPTDQTLKIGDILCQAIAIVFRDKLNDASLAGEYMEYSNRIKQRFNPDTPPENRTTSSTGKLDEKFFETLLNKIATGEMNGAQDLIVKNKDSAMTAFTHCMTLLKQQSAGLSAEMHKTIEMIAKFIATVFEEKLKDNSLIQLYQAYLGQNQISQGPSATTSIKTEQDLKNASPQELDKFLDYLAERFSYSDVTKDEYNLIDKLYDILLAKKDYPRLIRRGEILSRHAQNIGVMDKAIEIRKKILEIYHPQANNPDKAMQVSARLGNCYLELADLQNAARYFRQALEMAQKSKSDTARMVKLIAILNLSSIYECKYNTEEAVKYEALLKDAEDGFQAISPSYAYSPEDLFLLIESYNRLGDAYTENTAISQLHGNKEKAMEYLAKAVTSYTRLYSFTQNQQFFINNHPEDLLRIVFGTINGPSFAIIEQYLSFDELKQGIDEISKKNLTMDDRRLLGRSLHELAIAYVLSAENYVNKPKELELAKVRAFFAFNQASLYLRMSGLNTLLIDNYLSMASFYAGYYDLKNAENRKNVENALQEAYDLSTRQLHYPPGVIQYRLIKADYLEKLGKLKEAQEEYLKCLDEFENLLQFVADSSAERSKTISQVDFLYKKTAEVCIKNGDKEKAFEVLERLQGVQVVNSLDLGQVKVKEPEAQEMLADLNALKDKATEAEKQLLREANKPEAAVNKEKVQELSGLVSKTKAEFYQTVNNLRQKYPEYEKLVAVKPARFAKIQKQIPQDTVLVQYLPLPDKLYIFLVTQTEFKIHTVAVTKEQLDKQVRRFRDSIGEVINDFSRGSAPAKIADMANPPDQNSREMMEALQELHKYLIDPIAGEIAPKKVMAVIPTGYLYYLPFQALAKDTGNGVKFLVEEKQVVYLYNADLDVVEKGQAASFQGTLIAVGNPDGTLKSAETEAQQLKKLFPDAIVYLGNQATKEKIKQAPEDTRILHLATHGVLDSNDVNESFILMAGKGKEGRLKQGEIFELPLGNTALVTLSACQTALGEQSPGSEIASLATAFSIAGASSIVATLWSISDNSTNTLMATFYEELKNGRSRAEALQAAQMKLLKDPKYSHPFYWAPFILTGDWR